MSNWFFGQVCEVDLNAAGRGIRHLILSVFLLAPASADATGLCDADTAKSIEQVKQVLAKPQEAFMTDRDRVALLCLADALAKVNAKLEGLDAAAPLANHADRAPNDPPKTPAEEAH